MKIEISKPTLNHLMNKYPHLTESIIQYFFFCGEIKRETIKIYPLNKFEHMYKHYYVLHIPKMVANEFMVDEVLDLIPDEDGVYYKIQISLQNE